MSPLPLIVFDVNETLLDLTTMEPTFDRLDRSRLARECAKRTLSDRRRSTLGVARLI